MPADSMPDGVLEPWKISDVACVETGLIEKIHVQVGQFVQEKDMLAELDTRSVNIQLQIAESQAANLGERDAMAAEVALNERKVKAIGEARQKEFSSQLELERAEADLAIARGHLANREEEARTMQLQVAKLQQQLQQRAIVAPFSGIVTKVHKEIGEYVAPNTPEVIRLIDVSKLRASFFLKLEEIVGLQSGKLVSVRLTDESTVTATIEFVSPVADSESGLLEVRVLIENPEMKILGSRCSLMLDGLPST